MPPLIPNRKNRRLKCAFTVRSAMFKSRAISELSHPCSRRLIICRSLGPTWLKCSSIKNSTSPTRAEAASGAETCPLGASGFGSLRLILHSRGQNDVLLLTNCEIFAHGRFSPAKRGYQGHFYSTRRIDPQNFCSASRVKYLVQNSVYRPTKEHIYTEVHPQPVL